MAGRRGEEGRWILVNDSVDIALVSDLSQHNYLSSFPFLFFSHGELCLSSFSISVLLTMPSFMHWGTKHQRLKGHVINSDLIVTRTEAEKWTRGKEEWAEVSSASGKGWFKINTND